MSQVVALIYSPMTLRLLSIQNIKGQRFVGTVLFNNT